jgi:hypothetical protein
LVKRIQAAIAANCHIAARDQRLVGPVIDGLSVDVASKAALDRLAVPSAAVVLAAACWCLRSVRMGLLVFGLSVFAQGVTLATVHFCGETMSALLIVLPPLIQVLAVAGGIHLANYYFDALPVHGADGAPSEALRRGWLPCVLSFGTTAVGMASLMLSELTPIRLFGLFSSVGVLLTLGLLLAVLPALLAWWPIVPAAKRHAVARTVEPGRSRLWAAFATMLSRWRRPIIGASLLAMIVAGTGIGQLACSVRIETLFGAHSKIIDDYAWLEQRIGPLVPIEVDVAFNGDCPLTPEDRMTVLWQLNAAARRVENIGATFSALTLLPRFPSPDSLPADSYPRVVHEMLIAARPAFESLGLLAIDDGVEHWRLSMYVNALGDIDYGEFQTELRDRLDSHLAGAQLASAGVATAYTGIMPLVHEIQRQLMSDLFHSMLAAFAVITLIMTVAQAGVLPGLVVMIPNAFPTLVMFGILGWARMPLDIGTMMTASIALGIAVDDTLHYVTFFHRGMAQGLTRQHAVAWAYEHCGKAMLQTSVVCGLGLAVFAGNDFMPTQRFAWVMVTLMTLALAGDLLLLPALLISAAGKCFETGHTVGVVDVPHNNDRPPAAHYRSNAASIVKPGPKARITQGRLAH